MKKIIILSRVSTASQDLTAQTQELKDEAMRLGFPESQQIIIENVESGIKLSEEERLGLQKLYWYVDNDPEIDCVICWETSRLSRQQSTLFKVRDMLHKHRIQLYILNPFIQLLTDDRMSIKPDANIAFSLFTALAENEMMVKGERFKREKNKLREQNKKFAGAVIFGYVKNKEKFCVPHPLNGQIVADIFRHYVEDDNASLHETYQWCMRKWTEVFPLLPYIKAQHKIRNILVNEIYWKGNWCYPPLVTEELARRAREKMNNARCKARHNCKRELLCRGKLYCGHCGKMMTGSGGNTKAYICPTDKEHSLQINMDAMDWLMWREVLPIANFNSSIELTDKIREIKREIDGKQKEISQIESLVEDIKQKQEKILDLYLNERINKNMLDKRLTDSEEEKNTYTKKINRLNTEINEMQSILNDYSNNPRYEHINFDNITEFKNKVEIVNKYIRKAIITKEDDHTRIEFEYVSGIIIAQRGIYRYKNLGGWKHIWRINQDETIDLILNEKKIEQV